MESPEKRISKDYAPGRGGCGTGYRRPSGIVGGRRRSVVVVRALGVWITSAVWCCALSLCAPSLL